MNSELNARELVMQMIQAPVTIAGIRDDKDANNTKSNLLKQWKKLLREFAQIDGASDPEAEALTVGFHATDVKDVFVFELRKKLRSGAIVPRTYELIEPRKD